jgi:hypothetical protein
MPKVSHIGDRGASVTNISSLVLSLCVAVVASVSGNVKEQCRCKRPIPSHWASHRMREL